jgi:hypothetical protein
VILPPFADAGAIEAPEPDTDAVTTAAERLRRHARRLQLLADELQALALHELPRARVLAEERAALEAELAEVDADAESGPDGTAGQRRQLRGRGARAAG